MDAHQSPVVKLGLLFVAGLIFSGSAKSEPVTKAPAEVIGAGAPFWVDSNPDPEFAVINARVDVGTLRQDRDYVEARFQWPLTLGTLRDVQAAYPDTPIAEGSVSTDIERIVCRPNGALSYRVGVVIVDPAGKTIVERRFNASEQRRKAEEFEARFASRTSSFGGDPRSLVCWAVANKCQNRAFHWPPPPNETPLEYSAKADAMRAAYNAQFVPRCRL